jgi:uncharacterized protein (UPF0548 family)
MSARPLLPRLAVRHIDQALRAERRRLADVPFTYAEPGASLSGRTPPGYVPIDAAAVVGAGPVQFTALADGIWNWEVHRRGGLRVDADGPAAPGGAVVLAAMTGPVAVLVPCRVVGLFDEPRRKGFAYGTLPGHPEAGEEGFAAELGDDGAVTFRVFGFSRPGTVVTALGAPVLRVMVRHTLAGYLQAAKDVAQTAKDVAGH